MSLAPIITPRLDLRLKQTLAMTPQLQQAIKLLALSNVEIEAMIAETVERNPLLEIADTAGDGETPEALPADSSELSADEGLARSEWGEGALDTDWSAGSGEARIDRGGGDGSADSASGGDAIDFDRFAAPQLSLGDHLAGQARARLHGTVLMIVLHLIDCLTPAGYLDEDLREIAARLAVPLDEAEAALGMLQTFDPAGIGARDLAECIALQAKDADRYDPCMAALIANLDRVAKGRIKDLMKLCDVDEEDLMDMIQELRRYDPKPGLRFASDEGGAVTPDVFVARGRTGWRIEINEATLPRVLVNQRYYREIQRAGGGKEAQQWLGHCLAEANGLIRALDQRQRSILRVATEIVTQQEGFFLHGVARMRALTLKQVADAIGLHESTVSRVTSNKYLACARGTFELKYFFSSGVSADSGDTASAEAVKAAIRALIDSEGEDVLSDDTLVERLKAKGFDIARRTVAKYREAMGLGSSVQRRRQKKLGG